MLSCDVDADPDPNFTYLGIKKIFVFKIFNYFVPLILTKLVMCNFPSNNYLIDKKTQILLLGMGRDGRREIRVRGKG